MFRVREGWCKGGGGVETPPLFPFRAREGMVRWCKGGGSVVRKHPPPSCISSKGGGGVVKKTPPSISRLERGRGW